MQEELKDESFRFRIDAKTLNAFRKACEKQNIDVSRAIRNYMSNITLNSSLLEHDFDLSPETVEISTLYAAVANMRLLYSLSETNAIIVRILTELAGKGESAEAQEMNKAIKRISSSADAEIERANALMTLLEKKMQRFASIFSQGKGK